MINVCKDDHILHFLVSDCIELDNLIIALFKTKWQYYFAKFIASTAERGVDFFGVGSFFRPTFRLNWIKLRRFL